MFVLRLGLDQGGLRTAQLGFGIDHLAGCAPSGLAFGIARSLQFESLAVRGCLGRLVRRSQVITLDGGDQLTGLHVVAFIDRQGLNSARDTRAHDHLVGIYRADQLQIIRMPGGKEVPAEGDDEQDSEDDKDSIARVHKHFLQT